MKTTLSHISSAAKLAKSLVERSDINSDGTIRAGDMQRLGAAPKKTVALNDYVALLDQLRRTAAKAGGPTNSNVRKAVDTAVKKLKARDEDGSGALEAAEIKGMTSLEARMLDFAKSGKNKTASSFKMPAKFEAKPPKFSWKGTPDDVAISLLNAYSKPGNDAKWPNTWGAPARASRFVVNATEAKDMVAALKKLYVGRQIAVMEALEAKSQHSHYGCLSPTATGKKVLETYAESLGLELSFGQPAAPPYHVS